MSEGKSLTCLLCKWEVMYEDYTQHLADYHTQEQCEQCGAKVLGAVGFLQHLEECHILTCPILPNVAATTISIAQETTQQHSDPPDFPSPAPSTAHETSPATP